MLKKTISGLLLLLLLFGLFAFAINVQLVRTEPTTIIVPDDYPTIQEAINNANDGDTIFVRAGTYFENVVVNKSVSLVGENLENTIIDGQRINTVIRIESVSYVTITNFTVKNGAGFNGRAYAGISVYNSSHVNIINNIISNNTVGINCDGVRGTHITSSHITILNNSILLNPNGITILNYDNAMVAGNNIIAYNLGLSVGGGFYHKIFGNSILTENKGLELSSSINSTVVWNNITAYGGTVLKLYNTKCLVANNLIIGGKSRNAGDYGIYLYSSNENTIMNNVISLCKWGGIYAIDGESNTIVNNTITQSYYGIILQLSKYNIVSSNNLLNNTVGLGLLDYSDRNVLMINNAFSNGHGIWIRNSWYNKVYHNNFVENEYQVYSESSVNTWDNDYPSGGNYWSDYLEKYPEASEIDGSGLWDTPYTIDKDNQDRYPLMYPYGTPTYKLTITTTIGGTTTPTPGVHTYANRTIVEVTAIPNINYTFSYWELDGINAGSNNPIEVLMDSNHTLHAVFTPFQYYNLIISTTIGGTTNPAPGTYTYANGTVVSVTAIPYVNCRFEYWILDGANAGSTNPIEVLMDANHTLEAVFTQITYQLTISTTTGGTTNPTPGTYTYVNGTVVSITAIPEENYVFGYWELDGVNVGSENPINVLMTANHTLHAVFLQVFQLTITSTTGGTTNPPPGTYSYAAGTELNVTAIPNTGYSFAYWLLDGQKRTENSITILMDANHILTAHFVDDIKPEIGEPSQNPPPENVQPYQDVIVTVTVLDYGSGVKNVTLWYSLNNGTTWTPLNMTELAANTYQATIPGYGNCTWITYKIIAYDNAENMAVENNNGYNYQYHVIPEYPSTVQILVILMLTALTAIIWKTKRNVNPPNFPYKPQQFH